MPRVPAPPRPGALLGLRPCPHTDTALSRQRPAAAFPFPGPAKGRAWAFETHERSPCARTAFSKLNGHPALASRPPDSTGVKASCDAVSPGLCPGREQGKGVCPTREAGHEKQHGCHLRNLRKFPQWARSVAVRGPTTPTYPGQKLTHLRHERVQVALRQLDEPLRRPLRGEQVLEESAADTDEPRVLQPSRACASNTAAFLDLRRVSPSRPSRETGDRGSWAHGDEASAGHPGPRANGGHLRRHCSGLGWLCCVSHSVLPTVL